MVRAKVNELHHKIWQFSEFWYDVESALSKSREAITELKEGKRLAETALAHSSGSNMDPPRAGRGQKLRRFERMIESNFPKIRFCGNSLETFIGYYSANDVSWKILGDLSRIGKANKLDARDLKAFKGTKNWVEAKLAGSRRIYYRSAPSGETRVWVLVSRRSLQGGPDTHFMKKHDRA